MNWLNFVDKLPLLIKGTMIVVQKIKGATGPEKKAAVLEAIPEAIALTEFGAGRDLVADEGIAALIGAYIDAEKAAMKAKDALKAGILAKTAAVAPVEPS